MQDPKSFSSKSDPSKIVSAKACQNRIEHNDTILRVQFFFSSAFECPNISSCFYSQRFNSHSDILP